MVFSHYHLKVNYIYVKVRNSKLDNLIEPTRKISMKSVKQIKDVWFVLMVKFLIYYIIFTT